MAGTRHLTKSMRVALLAHIGCSAIFAYVISLFDSSYQPVNFLGFTASGAATAFYALVLGAPVVAAYGVPIFALLSAHGRARWPYVLIAGAAPGLLIAVFYWQFGFIVAAFGLVIAAIVRWVCGPGPNNSFKPKPLRGSA